MLLASTPARTFVAPNHLKACAPASTNCDGKIINSSRLAHHGLTKSKGIRQLRPIRRRQVGDPARNEEGASETGLTRHMVLKLEGISLWEGALSTIGQGLRWNDSNLPKGTVPRSQKKQHTRRSFEMDGFRSHLRLNRLGRACWCLGKQKGDGKGIAALSYAMLQRRLLSHVQLQFCSTRGGTLVATRSPDHC
jgi:hypothetical protein